MRTYPCPYTGCGVAVKPLSEVRHGGALYGLNLELLSEVGGGEQRPSVTAGGARAWPGFAAWAAEAEGRTPSLSLRSPMPPSGEELPIHASMR